MVTLGGDHRTKTQSPRLRGASEIDQHNATFQMADNVMMNEGALQQQGFREKDYQEEILRLHGQLVASQ